MKKLVTLTLILSSFIVFSQTTKEFVDNVVNEVESNSKLEQLAHELFDVIGPRLVGTPQMKQAHDWAIKKYESWGIEAYNHEWGKWRGWERGVTHVDLIEPRLRTLVGRQLAWSPSTGKKGLQAEVTKIPFVENKDQFSEWLETIKGKFVLISQKEITGRTDSQWEEYATEESFEKMKKERKNYENKWYRSLSKTGVGYRDLNKTIENAGAVGLISSEWSEAFGANKVFDAETEKIPNIDLNLEDYTMLYRLVENNHNPILKVVATSKEHGDVPTFNTIGMIKGVEKPDEYVMLSAHFDSWDGGQGTTDNGTGSIVMLEAMRILKKLYPNPKRTIMVGHWGSEEQGLNGSRAFVEDYPEIVDNIQALFNQDNGTGRVVDLSGSGFLHSYEYLSRWLSAVPNEVVKHIKTEFPGSPGSAGTDHASFIAAGAPAFDLSSLDWAYWDHTWHTNLDTYDKIVFDDLKNNVILSVVLAYMASEDNERASRDKRVMPKRINPFTGRSMGGWPQIRKPNRDGTLRK